MTLRLSPLLFCMLAPLGAAAAGPDTEWEEVRSRHFIVRYRGDAGFAAEVSRRAEAYYDDIADDLGFRRVGDFWLWDDRARITLYGSRADFLAATGAPAWAVGKASASTREISSFAGSRRFLDTVLPHEMTHLIFRDFLGDGQVPLWLEEGVAQWEEASGRRRLRRFVVHLARTNRLVPLRHLTSLDIRCERRSGPAVAFYAQAASVVGFLIETHGSDAFRKLCGQLRDGKSLHDALRFTYPTTLRTIEQLERAWRADIMTGK